MAEQRIDYHFLLTFLVTQDALSYPSAFHSADRMMSRSLPHMHDDEDKTSSMFCGCTKTVYLPFWAIFGCSSFHRQGFRPCFLVILSFFFFIGHWLIINLIQQPWSFEADMLINKQGSDIFILISNEKGTNCSNHSLKLRVVYLHYG